MLIPFSRAAPISAGTCLNGITPPVPPASLGRIQFETLVRCTPAIVATADGPPNVVMIVFAGSMDLNVAILETNASENVANMEKDSLTVEVYGYSMLSEWLRVALEQSEVSQSELSRLLTERLGRSIDRAAVNKMLTNKRGITGDELLAIEAITGTTAPKEILVPLKGRVGAGAVVEAIDHGETEYVEAPAEAKPNTVAVEVTGDSMFPAYEDGTLLYYSKLLPPHDMINRRCVVQLADQRIFVKVLRKGAADGVWTLQSLNPLVADITDVAVDWAAPIDWIKPR